MSDGPTKLAKPGAMPLDELILGEDDPTAAKRSPATSSIVPPSATAGSVRPKPKTTPSVRPPSLAPPSRDGDGAKRGKLTLRIPDDEISRPSLPSSETPAGGVAAISSLRPPSSPDVPRPRSPSSLDLSHHAQKAAEALKATPPATADDTLEIPPEQVRARLAALGVEPASSADEGRPTLVDLHAPFAHAVDEIGPPSEDIPVDTDDDDVTRPRLPVSRDSEEIKVEEESTDRVSDVGGEEVSVEDLVSVESLPAQAPPPPPRSATARSTPHIPDAPASAPESSRGESPSKANAGRPAAGGSVPPPGPAMAARRASNPALSPVASALAPPPMNETAANRKKTRPWWEELFGDDFIRTMAKVSDAQIAKECDFIEESLGCEAGAMILDLACGTGRHAIDLATRGYQVVGYDLSLAMLARASDEAQDRKQKINFLQGDMRDMTFDGTFDGVFSWNTSFGYFDEEKNAQVVAKVHRALKHGGQFLLDVINRDNVIKQSPSLAWYEGDGCICMDEMSVDFITSRMKVKRTIMLDDGRSREIEYSIRIYSLHELGKLLHDNGFRVAEVSGRTGTPGVFFGCESPRTLILAEKR